MRGIACREVFQRVEGRNLTSHLLSLTLPGTLMYRKTCGALRGLIGNSVKIGSGPAAVIGDESRFGATDPPQADWEGAASRVIREPEDLPH